jgi:hypothetical protein
VTVAYAPVTLDGVVTAFVQMGHILQNAIERDSSEITKPLTGNERA